MGTRRWWPGYAMVSEAAGSRPRRFRPDLRRGRPPPRVPRRACSAARQALPPSAKLLVKFVPRAPPPPPRPRPSAPAKVTDKATPPRGPAGEGRECGGGGARGEGVRAGGGAGRMRGAGPRMFPKCLKLVFGFSTLDKCGAAGGARPFPRSLGPGPGPCAGVRARTPARARPAPAAAERRPGPPGAGSPGPGGAARRCSGAGPAGGGAPAGGSFAFCSAGLRGGGGWRKRKAAPSRRGPR